MSALEDVAPSTHKNENPTLEAQVIARIYRPARSAMTSGQATTRHWVLEFTPEKRKQIDPLMGWTGSDDMNRQVQMRFDTRDEAVAYAERHKIAYQVLEPKTRRPNVRPKGYGQNFASERRQSWTH